MKRERRKPRINHTLRVITTINNGARRKENEGVTGRVQLLYRVRIKNERRASSAEERGGGERRGVLYSGEGKAG